MMCDRWQEFAVAEKLRVAVGTWNVNGGTRIRSIALKHQSLSDWLLDGPTITGAVKEHVSLTIPEYPTYPAYPIIPYPLIPSSPTHFSHHPLPTYPTIPYPLIPASLSYPLIPCYYTSLILFTHLSHHSLPSLSLLFYSPTYPILYPFTLSSHHSLPTHPTPPLPCPSPRSTSPSQTSTPLGSRRW